MRYLGNNTKLVPSLLETVDRFQEAPGNGKREIGYRALLKGLDREGLDEERPDGEGPGRRGFIFEHYTSGGAAGRVANTTGVYASFVKTMQPNAPRPLELRPIEPTRRRKGAGACSAFRGPAARLLESVDPVDLVYLDPPYNGRQYPAYYHIPELLALGWATPPEIRGKTGLIPDEAQRSDWCRKHRAPDALREVLEAADGRHILFSYNDEGHLDRAAIEEMLRERGLPDSYAVHDRPYRRYRSDADGPRRSYLRDDVREHLHYVRCA